MIEPDLSATMQAFLPMKAYDQETYPRGNMPDGCG